MFQVNNLNRCKAKLYAPWGYNCNIKIYRGKDIDGRDITFNKMLEHMRSLLNSNSTIYSDNFYTRVELPYHLTDKRTNLVETLHTHRKYNPTAIMQCKLKKGCALQRNTNVAVDKIEKQNNFFVFVYKTYA